VEADIVDRLLGELLAVKDARPGTEVNLAEDDIFWLCRKCREVRVWREQERSRRFRVVGEEGICAPGFPRKSSFLAFWGIVVEGARGFSG
jgi:hypothetical protein